MHEVRVNRWATAAIFFGAVLMMSSPAVHAQQSQPEALCEEFSELVLDIDIPGLREFITEQSNGGINTDAIEALGALDAIFGSSKLLTSRQLVVKNYEDAMVKIWRFAVFEKGVLYMRCSFINRDGDWVLSNYKVDTNEEKVALP